MIEEWKHLTDAVEVSNCGRVKKNGRIIKPSERGGNGYLRVSVGLKERYVHRLVLKTWKPQPLGKNNTNHINGNKHDNRVSNLEWSTNRENIMLAAKVGRFDHKPRERRLIKLTFKNGTFIVCETQAEASALIGADRRGSCINKALHGERKTTHGVKVEYYDGELPRPRQMELSDFGL